MNGVRVHVSLFIAFLLLACSAPDEALQPVVSEPAPPAAAIRTDRSRYAFRYGFYGPELSIVTTFKAPKDQTAYVMNCNGAMSTGLQRLVDGQWVNAWGAVTNGCLSEPIVVAPGAERTETIGIIPGAGAVIYPRDDRELIEPGTYRASWNNVLTSFDIDARPFGDDLPLEQRVSAPFVVDPAPPRPAVITSFAPAEGAMVERDTTVRITFDFARNPRLSAASLRLYVDGKDVTDQARFAGTELVFAPKESWMSGRHGVKLELGSPASSYSWQFIASAD
ncbi:MAG TPA: hypothetical protein VF057_03960 [Thermoanaerobaculia bacterium]